jgi:acetyl esterase/lipase
MTREYPELLSILNEKGLAVADQVKDYCSSDMLLRYPFASVKQFSDDRDPLRSPIAQQVLLDNKMGGLPPAAPYLLWHAKFDELISHASAVELDRAWCAGGTDVQFVTSWTSEHNIGAVEVIPTALPWLLDRFNGRAFHGNCPG